MPPSSASAPPAEWYLARDGQQFGPLSEAELNKLVELGHLRADDLLWRDGLADWLTADSVLPALARPIEAPPPPPPPQPLAPPPPVSPEPPPYAAPQPPPRMSPYQAQYPAPRPEPAIDPGALHHIPQRPMGQAPDAHPSQARPQAPAAQNSPRSDQQRPTRRDAAWPEPPSRGEELDDEDESGGRGWVKRAAIMLFFVSTLAAAGWFAYPYKDRIMSAVSGIGSGRGGSGAITVTASAPPTVGFAPTPQATDAALQKSELWRVLKRDFPDWYNERIVEAAELASAQKGDPMIAQQMMQKVGELRRRNSGLALQAAGPRLKTVAQAFVATLTRLKAESVDACFGYISKGETSASYLEMLAKPEHSGLLQTQLVAVFEAVADGRKLPKIYPQPRQGDYNLVVAALEQRGWGEADLQLFSDSQKLAKAAPAKVCQLVTDWFEAQLSLKDDEAQLRLLVDALRPVVAG